MWVFSELQTVIHCNKTGLVEIQLYLILYV